MTVPCVLGFYHFDDGARFNEVSKQLEVFPLERQRKTPDLTFKLRGQTQRLLYTAEDTAQLFYTFSDCRWQPTHG